MFFLFIYLFIINFFFLKGVVQMWLKKTPLDEIWIGTDRQNLVGYEVLHRYPRGQPRIIQATAIPPVDYSHVRKTYDWLPKINCRWWEAFHNDQFFWIPPQDGTPANLWDPIIPDGRPNAVTTMLAKDNTRPQIHIPYHQPTSMTDLRVGMMVALRPMEHYRNLSGLEDRFLLPLGESAPRFWIGTISRKFFRQQEIVVNFFRRDYSNDRKYVLDPRNTSGRCPLHSILLHNFELTKAGLLRVPTIKQLNLIFALSSSEEDLTDSEASEDSESETPEEIVALRRR